MTDSGPERPLNIALYADIYQPGTSGGVDAYFAELVTALATHQPGHRYTVLAPHPRLCPDITARFASLGVHIRCLNRQSRRERLARRVTGRLGLELKSRTPAETRVREAHAIDRLGFDVVAFPRNVVFVPEVQTPVALHLFDVQHEYLPEMFAPGVVAERQQQYSASLARADAILASTAFTRQTLLDKTATPSERITVVYPGLASGWEHAAQDTGAPDAAAVRERYGLPESFIFYPANPWPHKNHARLFAALGLLRERDGLRVPLVLTGRLLHEPPTHVRSLAVAARIEDQVTDLGFIKAGDLPALYLVARALVVPSLFEGFGLPLLEAMACGCPVACAAATCLPEVAGDAALLFDPLDPGGLADAIRRMWQDVDLRGDLIARGHRRVQDFSWANSTAQIVATYREIAGR